MGVGNKIKIRYALTILFCLSVIHAFGQTEDSYLPSYDEARVNYQIGKIELARDILSSHISSYPKNLRESALRLLSLCYISLDQPEKAEGTVQKLLAINPYYSTTVSDPQRFIDMVEDVRNGLTATITTASSQAEQLSEVPVPTTLITEEMIRNSGARNLQEVLAAFVPGMYVVDCNDDINIAMRGIYSNGQEKILIMLNGHRLNSFCTNIASPDFSISLEKLKQIEVLRGPASSLYGGVALTAVVNLITKQGVDLDGVRLKAGLGNYGQTRASLLFGKHYFDMDLLVWGDIYKADGEEVEVPPSKDVFGQSTTRAVVGRIGNKPSYDFGVQLKWGNLGFMYDTHFSQVLSPLTMSTIAKPYYYDKYRTFNGVSPSFATQSHHAELSYVYQYRNLSLKGSLTYDNSDLTHYQVISDVFFPDIAVVISSFSDNDSIFKHNGLSRYINGQEQTYGAQMKGSFQYIKTDRHQGSLAFGVEYSHFQLDDVRYNIGYNFTESAPEKYDIPTLGKGHENSNNAFLQLKHQWGPLILNAGVRYDFKSRDDTRDVYELSPRLALICVQPKWNIKLSYSKSFVDAPYLYRKTNKFMAQNTATEIQLDPESLHSLQFTFSGIEWIKGLNFEVNGFYNHAEELIMTHVIQYVNEGSNKTIGAELMANYRLPHFTADFNMTWMKALESTVLSVEINTNNNAPVFMTNLVLGWKPTSRLRLFSHLSYVGKQRTYNTDVIKLSTTSYYTSKYKEEQAKGIEREDYMELALKALDEIIYEHDIDDRFIVNLGAEYSFGRLSLGLNVRNLLNTHGYLSGMNTKLVPQKGRWYMFSVGYKF